MEVVPICSYSKEENIDDVNNEINTERNDDLVFNKRKTKLN